MGLAWLLAGCSTALPVASMVLQLSQFMQADEQTEPADHDLIARAATATAEGRYNEAEAYLDAALSLDPYDDRALGQLAVIYRLTGRPEKARRYEQMTRHSETAGTGSWTASETESSIPDEANNIQRFVALNRLLDIGLITEREHGARRDANLGALLPLTRPSPALDAVRSSPPARDLVERLETIIRFKKIGFLDGESYNLERDAILQGLMPMPKSTRHIIAVIAPKALDPETHQQWLDRLLAAKLITPEEYDQESAVLVGLYTPAAGSMDDADSAPSGRLTMNDRPLTVIDEDTMALEKAAPESADQGDGAENAANLDEPPAPALAAHSATRINIYLTLSRTPESARRRWEYLQQANGLALDGLIPQVSRVDLGEDRGIFFQLSAGPLADMAAAEALCDELLSRDFYCAPLVF